MSDPLAFLIVAGAFHTPVHYQPLVEVLKRHGHEVTCMQMAGTGVAETTAADDVKAVREATARLVEETSREVVVILHSFAGRPGGAALPGIRMSEYAKDQQAAVAIKGGLRGAIFLAALVISEEQARAQVAAGPQWQEWQREDKDAGLIYAEGDMKTLFYHDVPEPLAGQLIKELQPHSVKALTTTLSDGPRVATAPEFEGRRAYIYCANDAVLPITAQAGLIAATGTSWHTRDIETSHSPFASRPEELVIVIEELCRDILLSQRE